MIPSKSLHTTSIPSWVLLPMRLFLGITFVYAGIQKFIDPQFFNPNAPGYIGRQITGFALSSPLHNFLLLVEPHAILFGHLTAYGEIAIGLGTLFGLLFRPAAFFGMLLSIMFFLSATWRVYPYFYGADIVFIFCWLTMLLNGPLNTGLPIVDEWLTVGILQELPVERQQQVRPVFAFVLGTTDTKPTPIPVVSETTSQKQSAKQVQQQRRRYSAIQQAHNERRMFIQGLLTGGGSILGLVAVGYILSHLFSSTNSTGYATTSSSSTGATNTGSSSSSTGSSSTTTSTTSTGQSGSAIAQVSAVPTNSAVNFTIPSTQDPGVLVHLLSGQFVAYDALCTHAGCQVDYDPSSHLLLCPCHGSAFDPAKNGEVLNPPAPTALQSVTIHVDSATGAITLA